MQYNGVTFTVTAFGTIHDEPHGETKETMYKVVFDRDEMTTTGGIAEWVLNPTEVWMEAQDWDDFIGRWYSASRCYHDYDCCGNWYDNQGEVLKATTWQGVLYIIQSSTLNV